MTDAEKNAIRKQAAYEALAISKKIEKLYELLDSNYEECFNHHIDDDVIIYVEQIEKHIALYGSLSKKYVRTVEQIRDIKERNNENEK